MFVDAGLVIYSASDLAAAAQCEYALLRSFDHHLGWGPQRQSGVDDDELMARTASLGERHEMAWLEELRREHGDSIATIGRPAFTIAGLTAAATATSRAIEASAPVVYQAAMFDGRFVGFADFLIRDGDRYRVCDTKLARSAKVRALLQLAGYADTLAGTGVPITPEAELILGNGTVVSYPVDELVAVYRSRRAALQRLLDEHYRGGVPVQFGDDNVRACFRCAECEQQVIANDDLLLVARMCLTQRARLLDAGITTIDQLADHAGPIPEISARTVDKLAAQARLQVHERNSGTAQFEVTDAQSLLVLPDPDQGDLFFDFEADPLFTTDGVEWGLEYLFGVLDSNQTFQPLWAHDRRSERQGLLDFLKMVRNRRKRRPHMHIYHYGSYERSALLRLAGRYGVGEDVVDDLLRSGVLIDLYPLVLKSIRVGADSYSLKSLEPLYMGERLRGGDVTTAAESITEYVRYCELRDDGNAAEADAVLRQIADYNHYDCTSTRELRDWLLILAFESGLTPLGVQPVVDGDGIEQADQLERTLIDFAGDNADGDRTAEQTAVALVAAARGYHQREDKPFWWAHFDRLNYPVDEWADTSDVFVADEVSVVADWHTPPKARKPQRRVRLVGELAKGELPTDVFALYEPPGPAGMTDNRDRRAAGNAVVVDADDDSVPTEVVIVERPPTGGAEFDQLPFALTPRVLISTATLKSSIEATAADLAARLPDLPRTAIFDILQRNPPRTCSGGPLPTDIAEAVLDLDGSYLAVHGPPGTGKTRTAAEVVTTLVNDHGWRVGVVAQSHAVVEHLLECVISAGVDPQRVAKKAGHSSGAWQTIDTDDFAAFVTDTPGCVVGGTAWDFANDHRVPTGSLDLLVVEEAGQFCLANTIAVAKAARNLLLLGDPQQLPQVTQGTHPEPVDTSALGWLVDGRHTLPAEFGYFLDRSYRMHPVVCSKVSALSYEGRLVSAEERTAARCLDGYPPGLHTVLVDHAGNSTDSPEEADAIVAEIDRLIGRLWTDEDGTRPLTGDDVLVVAPYNAQVVRVREHLKAAGLGDVLAGTVDKFQGRQAPVVFVSMTASSIDDVPRGISFLLNRNRLNVAISRAKYASVIVRSPTLTDYLPLSPDGLIELGAFLSLSPSETP